MNFTSVSDLIDRGGLLLAQGPVALILVEDPVEVASTVLHHARLGFGAMIVFLPEGIDIPEAADAAAHWVRVPAGRLPTVHETVNRILPAVPPGTWLYGCYNAEYLFYPFCETRTVRELLTFHTEERRDAMLTFVVDLYAQDPDRSPGAVSREEAMLDRSGYYALARTDPDTGAVKERQLDFFGGLRWRFEEHVPADKRRIDRVALFRAKPGLTARPDHTFADEEYNTYSCPWHHNLTAAIASFRTAKALKTNPGSRDQIRGFVWHNSVRFDWTSQQLMDLGLMEPGQWF